MGFSGINGNPMIILTRGWSLFLVSNVPAPSIDLWERVPGDACWGRSRSLPWLCTLHYPAKWPYSYSYTRYCQATAHSGGRINSSKSTFGMRGGKLLKNKNICSRINRSITLNCYLTQVKFWHSCLENNKLKVSNCLIKYSNLLVCLPRLVIIHFHVAFVNNRMDSNSNNWGLFDRNSCVCASASTNTDTIENIWKINRT